MTTNAEGWRPSGEQIMRHPKELYLNLSGKLAYTITDDQGEKYSVAEARKCWNRSNQPHYSPIACNLAFSRLVENDFRMDAVRNYYNDH